MDEPLRKRFTSRSAPDRVQSTEFFKTDPERVAVILRRLPGRDITPRPNTNKKRRRRPRPPLDFIKMGIPVGSTLVSLRTDETATVTGARKVMFRDEEMSLTAATRLMLGTEHNIIPTRYWKYESELLRQRYNAIYGPRRKNWEERFHERGGGSYGWWSSGKTKAVGWLPRIVMQNFLLYYSADTVHSSSPQHPVLISHFCITIHSPVCCRVGRADKSQVVCADHVAERGSG